MIRPWQRPSLEDVAGNHEKRLRDLERKLGLLPNLICDDITGNALNYPWNNFTTVAGTSFSGDTIRITEPGFGVGPFYIPKDAYLPPVVAHEWVEFGFLLSVDTLSGYTSAAMTLAAIVDEAESSGGHQSGAIAQLSAQHLAGVLKFRFGSTTATDPGSPGDPAFTNNLTFTSIAIVAGQVYDVVMRGRVTDQNIFAQLYIDEVKLLDLTLQNPPGGSGGLHETGAASPRFGINSVGTGSPPTWTFDKLRYAIGRIDRRPCVTIESPHG